MSTVVQIIDTARALINEPLESSRTFPDDTSSFFADSTLLKFFNTVQQEIANNIIDADENYFLTSTFLNITDGCSTYDLPSGTIKIKRVEDVRAGSSNLPTEIRPVTINNRGEYTYEYATAVIGGGGYYIAGNQIVLTNTPAYTNASAVRLYYIQKPIDVTAGSTVSPIPENWHHVISYGVVKQALFSQQSENKEAVLEYEKLMIALRKSIEDRQIQKSRRVKSVYGDVDY